MKKIGKSSKRGTSINFLPSKDIFSSTKFSSTILQKRMRELAFLNKGISLTLIDKTSTKIKKYDNKFDGGILEFVQFINQKKPILSNKNDKAVFKKPIYIEGKNTLLTENRQLI